MIESRAAADATQRVAALDVGRSFIVQAPAGSGKTELLIQRFLVLLAHVDRPEAVVAMTFTRKAAGEIRSRVVDALREAANDMAPEAPHRLITWSLARAVLQRDVRLGWNLVSHPARLQILTIDALCASLMRQAPLQMKVGAAPRIEDRPHAMYVEAARAELDAAAVDGPAWNRLLDYTDNDANRTVALIANMLGKREQWLPHLVTDDKVALRQALEGALASEIESELGLLAALMPTHAMHELLDLAGHAGGYLGDEDESHILEQWARTGAYPPATVAGLPYWRALAGWLVTGDGTLRRRIGKGEGFPAKGRRSEPGYDEREARKAAMNALIEGLREVTGLEGSLRGVRDIPQPMYDATTWAFIEALLEVLPRVAARLKVVFGYAGAIDYAEATLIALEALGEADAPSDLLLSLDMRIQHLLVDEFQDTSLAQSEIIERLTSGWDVADGRTLFLVGDPMQSIYRFREADVGLFIAAQRDGRLGGVALETLTLARNFRSQPPLVDWVNRTFATVMGEVDVPHRTRVGFKAAVAALPHHESDAAVPAITFDACESARDEAGAVVKRIQTALVAGSKDIAVLVRKRTDLEYILPALREANIAFTSIDLDRLSQRQAILDLVSLAHAFVQPDDRLAWLAVLRAPWCGLELPDLFAVARFVEKTSIVHALSSASRAQVLAQLSEDGRRRFLRFVAALEPAIRDRGRTSLATTLRGLWLALGGPACVAEAVDLGAAERFFTLLATFQVGADVPDWPAFVDALDVLYAEAEPENVTHVQVMTLHRAKGLEFDVVVMPGLARRPRADETQLLRWRRRAYGLLLAPLKRRSIGGEDAAEVYAYLKTLAKHEDEAELGRLLYVGSTRARRRLHLVAAMDVDVDSHGNRGWKKPFSGTALSALWPVLGEDACPPGDAARTQNTQRRTPGVPLLRLPVEWELPPPPETTSRPQVATVDDEAGTIDFDWVREGARQTGTLAHRLLQRIAVDGIERWDGDRIAAQGALIGRSLLARGFTATEQHTLSRQVLDAIRTTVRDDRGRWLFDARHREAASEYALTARRPDGGFSHYVLDRTFIDGDDVRWIVDFKLAAHEGGDVEGFLDSEQARYRAQLDAYARAMRAIDRRTIWLGLYFPRLAAWRAWQFDG